jgi:hypothetical protein
MKRNRSTKRQELAQRPSKWERARQGISWVLVNGLRAAQTILTLDKLTELLKRWFEN